MIRLRFHDAPCSVPSDRFRVGAGLTLALALGLAIGLLATSPPVSAFEVARFYERSAEGWFWYAEEPPEP
ncbi:MAG: hypothetical protein ACLFN3_11280, partial [Halochromatium sp.]